MPEEPIKIEKAAIYRSEKMRKMSTALGRPINVDALTKFFQDHLIHYRPSELDDEAFFFKYQPGLTKEITVSTAGSDELHIVTHGCVVLKDADEEIIYKEGKEPIANEKTKLNKVVLKAFDHPLDFFLKVTEHPDPGGRLVFVNEKELRGLGYEPVNSPHYEYSTTVEEMRLQKNGTLIPVLKPPEDIPFRRIETEKESENEITPREISQAKSDLINYFLESNLTDEAAKVLNNDPSMKEELIAKVKENRIQIDLLQKLLDLAEEYAKH